MISVSKIHGRRSVLLALTGNAIITVFKFVGFFVSGSSALFSEAVHSFADTMNQSLLLVGIKRSLKKADAEFAYGYGQERFLWALISACGIFFLGAGVTAVHGVQALSQKGHVTYSSMIFYILIASFIIEAYTFWAAVWELKAGQIGVSMKKLLRDGDPTVIAVIYEDGVALLGVFVAFISISLSKYTGNSYWDGIGSIIIGLMLAAVAILLISKNRSFLIRKSIPESVKTQIIGLLEEDPAIERVIDFKSSVLDIGRYHIKCEIEFNGPALFQEIYQRNSLQQEFDDIDGDFVEFKKFFLENLDRVPRVMGRRIDQIEKRIMAEVPAATHIDIEIN